MRIELITPPAPENLKLVFGEQFVAQGSIRILGGRVPVVGRVFRVDRGVVRFGGDDPADPALDIDAAYDASDGTEIFVHVGGRAQSPKLALRSNPPKSESELLAILAFGGSPITTQAATLGPPPPAGPSAYTAGRTAATGLGAGVLANGINQLLGRSVVPIRATIAAGQSTTLASAAVDISDRVRVQYSRQFGGGYYGTQYNQNEVSFEWRFRPRWVLRTTIGDRGSSAFDVLWQRWY
jgi:translocation and assembly module TamB